MHRTYFHSATINEMFIKVSNEGHDMNLLSRFPVNLCNENIILI